MITRLYRAGTKEPKTLAYDIPTWDMNPFITKAELMEEYKYRMDAFYRDFANMPEVSGGLQFPEKVRLNRNVQNVLEMDFSTVPEKVRNHQRVLSIDPAFKNDSFGIGCGYRDGDRIVIDGVSKFQKNADKGEEYILPSDIRNYITSAIPALNIGTFIYDAFLTPELVEYVQYEVGLEVVQHIVKKPDYDRWRELQEGHCITKLDVVYNDYLEDECNQLIVTSTDTGKPRTDHTKYSSKDVADTVANCIWYLESDDANPVGNWMPIGMGHIV